MTPDEIKANVDSYFILARTYENRTPENVFWEINERMQLLRGCGLADEVFQDIFKKWMELIHMGVPSLISDNNVACKYQRDKLVQFLEAALSEIRGK